MKKTNPFHQFMSQLKLGEVALWIVLMIPVAGEVPSISEKNQDYVYLQNIEDEVGLAEFNSIAYNDAMTLVSSLSPMDRSNLSSTCFVRHLQHVQKVRKKFYQGKPLSNDEAAAYLQPFRVRQELTSKPNWLPMLASVMEPLVNKDKDADAAASTVIRWMHENLALQEPALSYPIPARGDLDPLTVMKGGRGNEIDLAIFGVCALRSIGVAARLVWAPALRGEPGGKVWLEYLSENKKWNPWIPSFSKDCDTRTEFQKILAAKVVFVMAKPEAPIEVTETYVETTLLRIESPEQDVVTSFLVLGNANLMPARGQELQFMKNERIARIGLGPVIIATSFSHKAYALSTISPTIPNAEIIIRAEGNSLSSEERPLINSSYKTD